MATALLAAACGSGGGSDPVDGVTAREDFNGVAAADMNLDGFKDLVAVDLQGDGLPDVVASSLSEAGFRVFLNNPGAPGTLLPGAHFGVGADPVGWPKLAVADMDGDARPDVVIADDSLLAYYPQSAASPGSFLAARTIGIGFEGVGVGDVDGDGLTDAATSR